MVGDGVEATTNRSQRILRFTLLWRKMMQGTCSGKGGEAEVSRELIEQELPHAERETARCQTRLAEIEGFLTDQRAPVAQ